jgi:predicted nuclease with TOPRIM domain
MQDDNRMVELLAEMLHEIKGLREGFQRMEKEQHAATERLNSVEMEQRRTTNAIWELSQMMQKVVWEPANKMAEDISDLKHRVAQLEGAK